MSEDEAATPTPEETQPDQPEGVIRRYGGILGTPTGMLVAIASAFVILISMRYARNVLNPILLAMFIVMGVSPVLHYLRRKGLPAWATVTIMVVSMVAAILLFIFIFVNSLAQLDEKLPVYQQNLQEMTDDATAWFADKGVDVTGVTESVASPSKVFDFLAGLVGGLVSMMTNLVLMLLIVVFMIAEVYSFPKKFFGASPRESRVSEALTEFSDVTRSFIFTKAWLSSLAAVIVTAVYYAFGVDFALLWGLLFFVLSFVPNIGFILSVIPPFLVTLLESGFNQAALMLIIVIILNTIIDNIFAPKVMARNVGLSTLTVFLSLFIWAWVLGGIGALIAVPMTLMVKHLFLNFYRSTVPVSAVLTGVPKPPKEKKTHRRRSKKSGADAET